MDNAYCMLMLGTKYTGRGLMVVFIAAVLVPGAIGLLMPSDRGPRL
jgi:hypothetical protein